MTTLTHFDDHGQAHMVNVSDKAITHRVAKAGGRIVMRPETLEVILRGDAKKGDVLGVARVAAIMAAKKTSELIPLCHPLFLTRVSVGFTLDEKNSTVAVEATAETDGKTGVEMEALVAASIALLTIYDMCKAIDRDMRVTEVCLLEKSGGKSGTFKRPPL